MYKLKELADKHNAADTAGRKHQVNILEYYERYLVGMFGPLTGERLAWWFVSCFCM